MTEPAAAARQLERVAHSIHRRGLTHGRTGNVAVRVGGQILVTPTGVSLDAVSADALSVIGLSGDHLAGPRPTKEAPLHAAMLRARPGDQAVVHTHSLHSAAVSCLADLDDEEPLPPLTAYYAMRVGRMRALPYVAPGDPAGAATVEEAAHATHALLLRNHGPIVSGRDVDAALDALEEIEHTAQVFLSLRGLPMRPLTPSESAALSAPTPPTPRKAS